MRIPRVTALFLSLASIATAQSLQVPAEPVQPGVPFTVIWTGSPTLGTVISGQEILHLLQPTGELITPELVGCSAVGDIVPPGFQLTLEFTAPETGPGSRGSFVLMSPAGVGAVARLDVGQPSASFPTITCYPRPVAVNASGHHVFFLPGRPPDWEFANTGDEPHRFAGGRIDILPPGSFDPVASLDLEGLEVPAGRVARILLPLEGLQPGPYTVRARFWEPGEGRRREIVHGISTLAEPKLDLVLPGGRVVPRGGSIPLRIASYPFSPRGATPQNLIYVVMFGIFPGSTELPGGARLPLVLDPISLASHNHGLFGIVSNHVGVTVETGRFCAHRVVRFQVADGIRINHPNIPAVSGLTLRIAAAALEPPTVTFGASQPERITFR